MTSSPSAPSSYRSTGFLRQHLQDTLRFHLPRSLDADGGFFHFFSNDGAVLQPVVKHLVGSTRAVFNFALGAREFGDPKYAAAIDHGITFLRDRHRNPLTGGYAWMLMGNQPIDTANHCYGYAFLLLAYARAFEAGHKASREFLAETWELMEKRLWEPQHGLYADEATADWKLSPYRGQNANMHSCEALIAAYETTKEPQYLERAALLADHMVNRQAGLAGGQVWEHYDQQWNVDWEYNREDPSNRFRPWGFQPGHQIEWAKLLMILDRYYPRSWHKSRAVELFDTAVRLAWDAERGGLVYGYDPQGVVCDADKYGWVQVETIATAAVLAETIDPKYWELYDRLWEYCWPRFIDHERGGWYAALSPEGTHRTDMDRGPAGMNDYHSLGACYEVLNLLRATAGVR